VIAASREAADDLVRRVTVSSGASFGIHRASLLQLAALLAAPEQARLGVAPASMLGTRRWPPDHVRDGRRGHAGLLQPSGAIPGFARPRPRPHREPGPGGWCQATRGAGTHWPAGTSALLALRDHCGRARWPTTRRSISPSCDLR
jgi:hypothetical protein